MGRKTLSAAFVSAAMMTAVAAFPGLAEACSRILWNDNGYAVMVGRTMDWPESTEPILTVFPRGLERDGGKAGPETVVAENPARWTSKYGSVVTTVYGIGTADGMNEKGLAAHLLYLTATDFGARDTAKKGVQAGLWAQYMLDNAATVAEALKLFEGIQPVMVECSIDRFEPGFHFAVIDCPTQDLVQRRGQVQADPIAVSVQPAARIVRRRPPQSQGAIEGSLLPDAVMPTVVMATGGGGFIDRDPGQRRELWSQALPQPASQPFAGRVVQAGQFVETGMVQFGVQRRPQRVDPVVVHPEIAIAQILIDVQDDLEAVTVHPPARMAGRNVGQPVGGLEAKAPPEVGVVAIVQIDAAIAGAVDADAGEAGQVQSRPQPADQIFVGRRRQMLVEEGVIQRRHRRSQPLGQHIAFGPWKRRHRRGECGSDPR